MKAVAPTNIAIVKYWGKNPNYEDYNIPTKSSLSISVSSLKTITELEVKKGAGSIKFELNGKEIGRSMKEYKYIERFFNILKRIDKRFSIYDYTIKTNNNFPTAAGFASSASGFAALAKAMQLEFREKDEELYSKYFEEEKHLSSIARIGSGSASRSIPKKGGFVLWRRGTAPTDKKGLKEVIFSSYSESVFDFNHWKELNIIYVKLMTGEKKVKSRTGMKITVKTNPLYWNWVDYEENFVIPSLIDAIKDKNFEKFGRIAMECSDALHAMMRYSYPPIIYTNDLSHNLMGKIIEFNKDELRAAYTFDAGANAIIFTEDKNLEDLREMLEKFVGRDNLFYTKVGKGAQEMD